MEAICDVDMVTVVRTALCVKLLCDTGQRTMDSGHVHLPSYLPITPKNLTTLNHLLYFFAFVKKVLEMEKMLTDRWSRGKEKEVDVRKNFKKKNKYFFQKNTYFYLQHWKWSTLRVHGEGIKDPAISYSASWSLVSYLFINLNKKFL